MCRQVFFASAGQFGVAFDYRHVAPKEQIASQTLIEQGAARAAGTEALRRRPHNLNPVRHLKPGCRRIASVMGTDGRPRPGQPLLAPRQGDAGDAGNRLP